MTEHSQFDSFTIKGHWWLPGSHHQKVAGEVTYDEESIGLSLYGGLNRAVVKNPLMAMPDTHEFDIIHGESLEKVPVTLLKSFYTAFTPDLQFKGRPKKRVDLRVSNISCDLLLVGSRLVSADQKFRKCRLTVPSLETWLGDSPFTYSMKQAPIEVNVKYVMPETVEHTLKRTHCVVRFVRAVRPPGFPTLAPSIQHSAHIEIEATSLRPAAWFRDRALDIVDLMSVMLGGNVMSGCLKLFRTGKNDGTTMFYPRHRVKVEDYTSLDIVIHHETVKASLTAMLDRWMSMTGSADVARKVLLSNERRPSAYIDLRFLPLVHAAEALANDVEDSTFIDPVIFRKWVKKVKTTMPGFPKELADSIKNALGYANGRSLRNKMAILLKSLQEETCRLFCVDIDKFVEGVVNTRNFYTHLSKKKRVLRFMELHWAIQKLSLMLRLLLLLKVGLSEKEVQSAVNRHLRLRQERDIWQNVTELGSEKDSTDDE